MGGGSAAWASPVLTAPRRRPPGPEPRQYIAHRLRVAGAQHDLFDDQALEAIYEVGQGNMRATDRVALKAMQLACRQAAPVVDAEHVARARKMVTP